MVSSEGILVGNEMMQLQEDVTVTLARLEDYPAFQSMVRLYFEELSRVCGRALSEDGAFKKYFEDKTRKALFVNVKGEPAGFVLLNQAVVYADTEWNVGEFFILPEFQNKGIGRQAAQRVWQMYPGRWEVSIVPENSHALVFWRKVISEFTGGKYNEKLKRIDYDMQQPNRYILRFPM